MGQPLSSFWGNISHIKEGGLESIRIAIKNHDILVRKDGSLSHLRVTSGPKQFFLVLRPYIAGMYEIVAVYGPSKAGHRLVLSLRELNDSGRLTVQDLKDWDPDYLLEE